MGSELFAPKDDQAWLKGLLEREEITSEQFEGLSELFKEKAESDKDGQADRWWKNISKEDLEGSFHPDVVPDWIKEHNKGQKDWSKSWSFSWSGKDKDEGAKKLAEAKEEFEKEAAEAKQSGWDWPWNWGKVETVIKEKIEDAKEVFEATKDVVEKATKGEKDWSKSWSFSWSGKDKDEVEKKLAEAKDLFEKEAAEAKKQGWNWSWSWDKVEFDCKKKIEDAKEVFETTKEVVEKAAKGE